MHRTSLRWIAVTLLSLVVTPPPTRAAAPQLEGAWSELLYWGVGADGTKHQAVHSILLKNGKVLCISEPLRVHPDGHAFEYHIFVWTPPAIGASSTDVGTFQSIPKPDVDGDHSVLYASGHGHLSDGRVLIVKEGIFQDLHNPREVTYAHTFIFDPDAPPSRPWTLAATMPPVMCPNGVQLPGWRFYPACNTLGDGRVLVIGGDNLYGITVGRPPNQIQCHTADIPLIYDPFADTWTEIDTGMSHRHIPLFPNAFLVAGRNPMIFYTGFELSAQPIFPYDPAIVTDTQSFNLVTGAWSIVGPDESPGSSSATYWPNRIIKCGGGTSDFDPRVPGSMPSHPISGRTWTIDPIEPTPKWTEVAGMNIPRRTHNLIVLPDGKVLATGGQTSVMSNGFYSEMATLDPELYSPAADTWTVMASMSMYRAYHSTAYLLPDARVVVAGNRVEPSLMVPPPPEVYLSAQIYSPPYLFQGYRPTIVTPPAGGVVRYHQPFNVATDRFVDKACLIRLPAVTHAFNQDQHYVPLSIRGASLYAGLYRFRIAGPTNRHLAPPGYYMLFVLERGVPSVAAMVRLL